MKNATWTLALAAALTACGSESPVAPTPDATMGRGSPNGAQTVTVMQQNMYVGTDVDAVIRAILGGNEGEIAQAIGLAIATLQNTDIVARSGAIADQIAKTRPHVVGLQEVSTIAVGPMTIPFLGILEAALAARGLNYGVCEHENFTVAPVEGVTLTDADALLYDRDRMTSVACGPGGAFFYQIGVLGITRGWGSLTGVINGSTHTFVVTHLESGNDPGLDDLRTAQAMELVATFAGTSPVTLLGDFNAFPNSDAYAVLTADYTDLWAARHPGAVGYTCCFAADLSNKVAKFDQRIDYIFARDLPTQQGQTLISGNTPGARVPGPSYPIWPSDHAGLLGTFLSPAAGTR